MTFDGDWVFDPVSAGSHTSLGASPFESSRHDDYYREATFLAFGSGDRLLGVGRVQISPERDLARHDLKAVPDCRQTIRQALVRACLQFASSHGLSQLITLTASEGPGRLLADSLGARYQQADGLPTNLIGFIPLQSAS